MKDIYGIKLSSNLFSIIALYLILIASSILLKNKFIFIILFEFLIFIFIQILTNIISLKEFYFLFSSTILFIVFFIILQKNSLNDVSVNHLLLILVFYINWYYFTTLITNAIIN